MEPLREESGANGVEHFSPGRKHTQRRQRAAVNDGLVVYQHFEFAVPTLDHLHVDAQLASEPRRHTDGVEPDTQYAQ